MKTLILNRTNLVQNGQNNVLVYRFPNSVSFNNSMIAFASGTMYYSWFNITASEGNNIFSYNWIPASGIPATFTITIPDGLYEISELNSLLQFNFIINGHYLVNSSGQNVYYADFVVNPTRYAVQINTYLFPISLPVGFTNPSGLTFPPQSFNPIITLPARINEIMGYIAGFATAQNLNNSFVAPVSQYVSKFVNGTISYLSTVAPNVQPNSSLLFSISNVDNEYSNPSSILYTLVPQVSAGSIIVEKPPELIFNKLTNGTYNEIRLTILGTNLNPIRINDPEMTIILVIKNVSENEYK